MEWWHWGILAVLSMVILLLGLKIVLLYRAAREIEKSMEEILKEETNSLITISSRDPFMCRLADSINRQLRLLHQERHRYVQGDRNLKESITNISHDIRTPLTAICGYLDLLEQEEWSDNARSYLQIIRNRSERLRELTEELFHYAVITSAEPEIQESEDVVLNHVLEECVANCYLALQERGIMPEIRMPEQEVHRHLNKNAVVRIYENVLSNAVKYSDGDLSISLSETGKAVFANHAASLSEVQVDRLFERFYTVEDARNSTGLGLTVAKILTEQMGGEIQAKYEGGMIRVQIDFSLKIG